MSSYKVVAPLVLARDKEDRTHHVYEGGVIDWLSDEQRDHFLDSGLVVEVNADPDDEDEDGGVEKPNRQANKADLVAWLVANVSKDDGSDYTTEELDALTKDQLWALIDSVE